MSIRDRHGNALVSVRPVAETELTRLDVPASLVVVVHVDVVLMMFDSWREEWELPGGKREPGETPREAAVRELHEETGIHAPELTIAAVAEFDLVRPTRHEFLAVYRVDVPHKPRLVVNDEALAFRWWPPSEPVDDGMSPLDAEIARRVSATG